MSFDLFTRRFSPENDLSLRSIENEDGAFTHGIGRGLDVDVAAVMANVKTAEQGRKTLGDVASVLKDAYDGAGNFPRGEARQTFKQHADAINRFAQRAYRELPKTGPLTVKDRKKIVVACEQSYELLLDASRANHSLDAYTRRVEDAVRTNVRDAARDATDLGKRLKPYLLGAALIVGGGYALSVALPLIFLKRRFS